MKLNKLDDEVVFKVGARHVSRRFATELFNKVASKKHWKYPIDAEVTLHDKFQVAALECAITFFTGSVASVEKVGVKLYRVKADGYYLTIGA